MSRLRLKSQFWEHGACSSHSAKEFAKNSSKSSSRPICLHSLRIFDQTNRGRKLRVLHRRSQSRGGLCVRDVRGHFENFFREMIDTIEKTASTGNENAGTEIIDERLFSESAFEEFKDLQQPQIYDRVQRFALDLLPGKTRIVL